MALHVAVNAYGAKLDDTAWKEERVNVTLAATGDWYTCTEITEILGAMVSPAYAMLAADSIGITWTTNVVTFAAVAGAATGVFELIIWGI